MLLIYFAETSLALLASVGLFCLYKWALARGHSFLRPLRRLERMTLAMLIVAATVATIKAQKSGGNGDQGTGGGEQETTESDDPIAPPRSGGFEVTNLCFTGISVSSTNIIPAKILPVNYAAYIGDGRFLPSVTFDQEEKLLVSDIISLQDFANRSSLSASGYPKSMIRSPFYENVIGGDSGNPRFLILENRVVLLYTLWKGGGGSGCFITHYRQEIQDAMDRLCPGYVLQEVDLSPFDQLDSIGGR